MNPKRVLWIAAVAAIAYIGVAIWVINNIEIPPLSGSALLLVVAAGVCQISAKYFFGLLFRESVQEAGGELKRWSAFKAALVGAGIARLIPAGGAITPVGMSWTVRDEVDGGSTGPAVRTVLLNYAGLLMLTGVGLFVARVDIPGVKLSLFVLSPFIFLLGLVLMFGSGKLGTLSKYLPKWVRDKVEDAVIDHLPGLESQAYIWARLLLEAAALWLVLTAFGINLDAFQVMATFGASSLAGGLPGTPGGLGVIEGTLGLLLVAYGVPASSAVAPVLIFRVVSYWLPSGLGLLAGGTTFLGSDAAKATEKGGAHKE
ncbi:MAG: flippase-like domain-containing protein [Acidimicrobiia bacterium]